MSLPRSFASFACALASLGTAHAEWQALAFTFEPLACSIQVSSMPPQVCDPRSLSGMFAYDDADDDGHVVLGELLELRVGDIVFPSTGFFGSSRVARFDYSPQTGLHFSASDGYRLSVTTGVSYRYDMQFTSVIYAWTPTTTTRVYAIPEPGTAWLVIAGAAVLSRRRRSPTA